MSSSTEHSEVHVGMTGVVIPLKDGLRVKVVPLNHDTAKITLINESNKQVPIPETFQIFNEKMGSALVQPGEDLCYSIALGATYSIYYNRELIETITPTATSRVLSFDRKSSNES